jgi:hypothetical protein
MPTQYLTHAAGEPARSWPSDAAQKPSPDTRKRSTSIAIARVDSIFCAELGKSFKVLADLGELVTSPYAQKITNLSHQWDAQ